MHEKIAYYLVINKSCIDNNFQRKNDTEKSIYILKKMLNKLNMKFSNVMRTKDGKPYFKDSNIHFNYSHSKNYIACVVSYYDVGIDIEEKTRVINDSVAKKYLDNVEGNENRIEMWVRKEAYSKLIGMGLQIGFDKLDIDSVECKSFFINENDYMCCIYCESDVVFEKINIFL